jgi:hypothetical protein
VTPRPLFVIPLALALSLAGCAGEKVDPLAVVNSATINEITDNTGSDYYDVTSAYIEQDGISTRLTLGFAISNTNGTSFSPVSTVTFTDGTILTCEAGDPRRTPSLEETTDDWTFECDGDLPEDADGASMVVIDEYE